MFDENYRLNETIVRKSRKITSPFNIILAFITCLKRLNKRINSYIMEQTAIITLLITAIGVILAAKPGRRTTIALCTTFTLMGFFYVCILNLTKKEFKIIDMNLFLQWNISTPFLFTSAAIATLILIVMVRRKKRIKPPTDQHAWTRNLSKNSGYPIASQNAQISSH